MQRPLSSLSCVPLHQRLAPDRLKGPCLMTRCNLKSTSNTSISHRNLVAILPPELIVLHFNTSTYLSPSRNKNSCESSVTLTPSSLLTGFLNPIFVCGNATSNALYFTGNNAKSHFNKTCVLSVTLLSSNSLPGFSKPTSERSNAIGYAVPYDYTHVSLPI